MIMSNSIKSTHYLAEVLRECGVTHVFGVQGGAVVHIFDSLHTQTDIQVCYTHHEQSAALCAVSYAKRTKNLGVCITTTGPAASNALTGLLAAWQDSSPVLFISGQTRAAQTSYGLKVRQRGSQECNILDVVSPWTKYSALVREPSELPSVLKKAYIKAFEGRPGPVWIDFPVDLQWSTIENNSDHRPLAISKTIHPSKKGVSAALDRLFLSKRPIFVLGRVNYDDGILDTFLRCLKSFDIPIACTWGSATISKGLCVSTGIIGVSGQPSANYSIRAADYVVFIGCHFSVTQAGNNYKALSDKQTLVFVNIDKNELEMIDISENTLKLEIDANLFIHDFLNYTRTAGVGLQSECRKSWISHIKRVAKLISPESAAKLLTLDEKVNPHSFLCSLYKRLEDIDIVVIDGGGCALYAGFQCLPYDARFAVYCSTSISAMGTGLPELCGASIGSHADSLNICVIGDGSLMFNLQELQTIKSNIRSSVIIVLNNSGYLAIRHTQSMFLESRFFGTSGNGFGVDIPSISAIAKAFGFDHVVVNDNGQDETVIEEIACSRGYNDHVIIELMVPSDHTNLFTASFVRRNDSVSYQQDLHLMKPFEDFDYNSLDV